MPILMICNKTSWYIYQLVSGESPFAVTCSDKEYARKIYFYDNG